MTPHTFVYWSRSSGFWVLGSAFCFPGSSFWLLPIPAVAMFPGKHRKDSVEPVWTMGWGNPVASGRVCGVKPKGRCRRGWEALAVLSLGSRSVHESLRSNQRRRTL
jgi:hypothetical protein